jgi:hypothetical protein
MRRGRGCACARREDARPPSGRSGPAPVRAAGRTAAWRAHTRSALNTSAIQRRCPAPGLLQHPLAACRSHQLHPEPLRGRVRQVGVQQVEGTKLGWQSLVPSQGMEVTTAADEASHALTTASPTSAAGMVMVDVHRPLALADRPADGASPFLEPQKQMHEFLGQVVVPKADTLGIARLAVGARNAGCVECRVLGHGLVLAAFAALDDPAFSFPGWRRCPSSAGAARAVAPSFAADSDLYTTLWRIRPACIRQTHTSGSRRRRDRRRWEPASSLAEAGCSGSCTAPLSAETGQLTGRRSIRCRPLHTPALSFPLLLRPVDLPSDQRGCRTHVTLSHVRPAGLGSQTSADASLDPALRPRRQGITALPQKRAGLLRQGRECVRVS